MPEEFLRLLLGGVGWGLGTLFAGQGDIAVSNYYQSQVNQDQAKVCKVPVYYLQHLFKALVFVYL